MTSKEALEKYKLDKNLRGAYLRGADLEGADLRGADLGGADLYGANLRGAYLRGAYLRGADLRGANLGGAKLESCTLPENIKFEEFILEVVPALLTAGGRTVSCDAWECHSWDNCPMAEAFGVHEVSKVPPAWRIWAERFVQLFDAGHIPAPKADLKEQD